MTVIHSRCLVSAVHRRMLLYAMTPDFSKDIRCHEIHLTLSTTCKSPNQTQGQRAGSLVIVDEDFDIPARIHVGRYGLICTPNIPRVTFNLLSYLLHIVSQVNDSYTVTSFNFPNTHKAHIYIHSQHTRMSQLITHHNTMQSV